MIYSDLVYCIIIILKYNTEMQNCIDAEISIFSSKLQCFYTAMQTLLVQCKIPRLLWPRYIPEFSDNVHLNL